MQRTTIFPGNYAKPTARSRTAKTAGTLSIAAALALGMGMAAPAHADGAESPDEPSIPDLPSLPGGEDEGSEAPGGEEGAEEGAGEGEAQPGGDYQRGPDPSEGDLVEAGPFDVDDTSVSSLEASGFGGGTIYHPSDSSEGTFGAVAISPGYTAGASSMAWYGERLASHGFVAFTIDTNSRVDQPDSRGEQLQASLDYLTQESDVADQIDADRLAVSGHSMGGGGTLAAAESNPDLKAAIPLAGWHLQNDWGDVEVPTMVVGAEDDSIASVDSHSVPFYESLSGDLDKAYLELSGASHFAPNLTNDEISKFGVSWLKRFVDEDERYEQFLCPPPETGGLTGGISDYRDSCPHGGGSSGGEEDSSEDGGGLLPGNEEDDDSSLLPGLLS